MPTTSALPGQGDDLVPGGRRRLGDVVGMNADRRGTGPGCLAARATQAALDGAVVATATIRATPAARARSSTAGRSAGELLVVQVSVGVDEAATSDLRRLAARDLQRFQFGQVPPLHRQELFQLPLWRRRPSRRPGRVPGRRRPCAGFRPAAAAGIPATGS